MEVLSLLEKKITDLLTVVKERNFRISELNEENKSLREKIDALETIVLKEKDELDQEKELTKMVVDGLIKNIDSIVESENQQ